jgi:TetR/AcrR family transcriptional regulator, lmrAB and yxaGH operons repressor
MSKTTDAKQKTAAAAARLLRRQGYHGTGLHDILEASGSPRGSLYFHYPRGKEEIGEAALALAAEAVRAMIAGAAATSADIDQFLGRIARGMAADLERSNFTEGCPIATTALETSAQSEILGASTRAAFQAWEAEIARGLERLGMKEPRAALVATLVLSQLEGALLLARTYRDLEPLRRAERALRVLASGSGE